MVSRVRIRATNNQPTITNVQGLEPTKLFNRTLLEGATFAEKMVRGLRNIEQDCSHRLVQIVPKIGLLSLVTLKRGSMFSHLSTLPAALPAAYFSACWRSIPYTIYRPARVPKMGQPNAGTRPSPYTIQDTGT